MGEITGSATTITCDPYVTATVTEAVWKARIAENYMVKKRTAGFTANETQVTFLAADDKYCYGRLIGWTGTGEKFKVTVETRGLRGSTPGGGTGAWASTDYGDRMKADSNHKLIVDNSQTDGNMLVVGGTKDNPYIECDSANLADS